MGRGSWVVVVSLGWIGPSVRLLLLLPAAAASVVFPTTFREVCAAARRSTRFEQYLPTGPLTLRLPASALDRRRVIGPISRMIQSERAESHCASELRWHRRESRGGGRRVGGRDKKATGEEIDQINRFSPRLVPASSSSCRSRELKRGGKEGISSKMGWCRCI